MCVLSFMYKQAFPNEKPDTFHEWVANQFGERLFSIFFKTYTEKVWGMSCDEISADWAAQRIKGLDLWSAMSNALRNSVKPKGAPGRGATASHQDADRKLPVSPQGSRHDVGRRRLARCRSSGGKIHMGTRLDSLSDDAREALDDHAQTQDGETKAFTSRQVISSAPIRELVHASRHSRVARMPPTSCAIATSSPSR